MLFLYPTKKSHKIFRGKIELRVHLSFSLAQHIREEEWIKNLVDYLKCGRYSIIKNYGVISVSNLSDIVNIIIPF